ncbi:MAG: hypothetical protein R8K53_03955 [Mariprofundaceae bacterium]
MNKTKQHNGLKNSITASLEFDFRGQRFSPSLSIDLDSLIRRKSDLNALYDMLAASIGLDAYRHEYDVMVMHDIVFSQPEGMVCEFIDDGKLDFPGFTDAWQQQQIVAIIQPIAEKYLSISDLVQHNDLEKALIESYRAGQENPASVGDKSAKSGL